MTSPIGNVLLLSTAHLPLPDPDFGACRSTETEYGWVFWPLDPDDLAPDALEPWLATINRYAYKNECMIVEFDPDNEVCEGFEDFS